ncbi:MAG TPA: transglycosylase SLT domain-containing protein, partial [Acinetobacter sp.]|nr:transglycosylase SLT domain-containing protein [Acinetobacter sp.]
MNKSTILTWQTSATSLFKITVLTSALTALGITTGCSSTPQSTKVSPSKPLGSGYLDASSLDSLEDLLSATDMRAVEGDRLLVLKHGDVWKRMTVGFKMDLNHSDSRIEAQRSWFISRQPYLDRLSARASRYLYHTVKEAERRGMPTELALLPVIESSYDPAATSNAAAAGLWQFIPSTGRIYGLQQTGLYDGRRDVVESTRAAYEFLGSLYNQFGSWELALAAYNAGPGRIQQAINRNRAAGLPTDYWSLRLPQETMNYVPRFLAVAQIIKNPSAYGVALPPIANRPHFREISLSAPLDLNQVAAITGLSRAELYTLNPAYRGDVVDPSSPMRILIPADLSPSIDARLRGTKAGAGGLWASAATPP